MRPPAAIAVSSSVCWVALVTVGFASTSAVEDQSAPALLPIVAIATDQNLPLSIDPDVLGPLTGITIQTGAVLPRFEDALRQLQPHGIVVVPVQLSSKVRVGFLTERANAVYCAAIGNLKRGNPAAAREALETVLCDQCEFMSHCVELRDTLDELAARRAVFAGYELEARRSVQRLRVARAGVATATASMRSGLAVHATIRRIGPDLATTFAASARAREETEAARSGALLDPLQREILREKQAVEGRLQRVSAAQLRSEEYFLIRQLATSCEHYVSVQEMLQREGLAAGNGSIGNLPAELGGTLSAVRRSVVRADCCVQTATVALDAGGDREALRHFAEAFALDRANPLARIGLGYCLLKKYGLELSPYCGELTPKGEKHDGPEEEAPTPTHAEVAQLK